MEELEKQLEQIKHLFTNEQIEEIKEEYLRNKGVKPRNKEERDSDYEKYKEKMDRILK